MGLRGFLTQQDAENIKLETNNVKLEYNISEVGDNIPVNIVETDIINYVPDIPGFKVSDDYYFSLSGENSENYTISRNSFPQIIGDILPREINVLFNNIVKEYDGTTSISPNNLQLYYTILPTQSNNSGIVLGNKTLNYALKLDSYQIETNGENYKIGDRLLLNLTAYEQNNVQPEFKVSQLPADEGDNSELTYNNASIISIPYNYFNEKFSLQLVDTKRYANNEVTSNETTYYPNNNNYINYPQGYKDYSIISTSEEGKGLIFNTTWIVDTIDTSSEVGYEKISDSKFIDSDFLKVLVECDNIEYSTSNVTNGFTPLIFTSAKLKSGPRGDSTNNYKIKDISGFGQIVPRGIIISFEVDDKVYDGACDASTNNFTFYNIIEGDEVIVTNNFKFSSPKVGKQSIKLQTPMLSGKDCTNYLAMFEDKEYSAIISPRPVSVDVNYIRIRRGKLQQDKEDPNKTVGTFEISYMIDGMISGDIINLSLENCVLEVPYVIRNSNGEVIESGNTEISSIFLNEFQYEATNIIWDNSNNSVTLLKNIEINSKQATIEIPEGLEVTLKNLSLVGNDSDNYTLSTTESKTNIYFSY